MSAIDRRPFLVLVAAFFLVPAARADEPSPVEDLFAVMQAPACVATGAPAGETGPPDPLFLQPHCCSQQEVDACRANCKAQGPGCKGQIGCRAGECVCTCNCP